jgi:soluble lytic murein transglycosylase
MIASILLFVFVVGAGVLIVSYDKLMYPLKYEDEIVSAGNEFNVEPALIASIINVESRFNENAVSNKGAVGLMQVMPSTAGWVVEQMTNKRNLSTDVEIGSAMEVALLGLDYELGNIESVMYDKETQQGELLDAHTNIRIGTYYLSYLLDKFETLELAICAYNAGEGTVRKWLRDEDLSFDGSKLDKIPYKETEDFLNKVLNNLKVYEKKLSKLIF